MAAASVPSHGSTESTESPKSLASPPRVRPKPTARNTSRLRKETTLSGEGGVEEGLSKAGVEEYIDTKDLQPLTKDPALAIAKCLQKMQSEEWTAQFMALNTVRRVAIHHSAALIPSLPQVIAQLVKLVDSLRSSVSRNALKTVGDFFQGMSGAMGKELDNLLPMLAKRACDTNVFLVRFVCASALGMCSCSLPFFASMFLLFLWVPPFCAHAFYALQANEAHDVIHRMLSFCSVNRSVSGLCGMAGHKSGPIRGQVAVWMDMLVEMHGGKVSGEAPQRCAFSTHTWCHAVGGNAGFLPLPWLLSCQLRGAP